MHYEFKKSPIELPWLICRLQKMNFALTLIFILSILEAFVHYDFGGFKLFSDIIALWVPIYSDCQISFQFQCMLTAKFHGCQMHISKIRVCHGIPGTHAYATSVSTCVSKVGISYFKPITKDIYEGSLPKILQSGFAFYNIQFSGPKKIKHN